jgi:hypothetical protein
MKRGFEWGGFERVKRENERKKINLEQPHGVLYYVFIDGITNGLLNNIIFN